MRLLHGDLLWMLLLLLPLGYLLWRLYHRATRLLPAWLGSAAYRRHHPLLKNGLRLAAAAFLLLALLGPYFGRGEGGAEVLGRQVYFLLDVSASMNAQDIAPSRLAKAKQEIRRVAEQLRGEQLGLIAFTDAAYVQCPLTRDVAVLETMLDILSTDQYANTGTNFRNALNQAYLRFIAENRDQRTDRRLARAVVLVTDGEDHGETKYQSVLNGLESQGVRVFVVGVGTPGGSTVPNLNADGQPAGTKRRPDGTQVVSKLEVDSLRQLANTVGHALFLLDDGNDDLIPLAAALKNMPAGIVQSPENLAPLDRYQWLLLPAILCLAASLFLLPVRPAAAAAPTTVAGSAAPSAPESAAA